MRYDMEELIPVVARLAERYTGYESTSVTYEKANELMEAVIYCIQEYEKSEVWKKDMERRKNEGKNIVAVENISAKEAYERGYLLVDAKVRAMKEMYHGLLKDFHSYGNAALRDTVDAVPEFLKWYDIRFGPQNTILTLDYPLLEDLHKLTGIDAVYEYVKCICIEQEFLGRFPEKYVKEVLRAYSEDYEEIFENLCGIILADVAGHLILKKRFDDTGLTEDDKERVRAVLGVYSENDAKRMMRQIIEKFLKAFCRDNGEAWSYMAGECDNITVRIIHSV